MARCKVLHGNVDVTKDQVMGTDPQADGDQDADNQDAERVVTVLFSLHSARFVGLAVGEHVRIHPPW
jgi:hypothetical protein